MIENDCAAAAAVHAYGGGIEFARPDCCTARHGKGSLACIGRRQNGMGFDARADRPIDVASGYSTCNIRANTGMSRRAGMAIYYERV